MTRPSEPGVRIDVASVPNLRDIGGYPTRDGGTVRTGRLYRSAELGRLRAADAAFARLNIRTVFDLRTAAERSAHPDRTPDDADMIVLDVLRDSPGAAPAQLLQLLSDPAAAQAMLGDGRAVRLFEQGYRDIVSLPSALSAYRAFFTEIARAERLPALFHCTTGKDRTGWAAAATLLILGVPDELVFHDYELTNRDLLPALQPLVERFAGLGGDPDLLAPVLGVDAGYLRAALDEMAARFGSIEGYFSDGLRIDADGQAALRRALVAVPQ